MTKNLTFLYIVALSFLLTSCFDAECIDETEAYVKVSLYSYETKKIASPDSITLYGVGSETKIYDNNKVFTSPALMPLKSYDNESTFVIEINGTTDTIRIIHSNFLNLISKECGYSMYHTIDTIYFTAKGIDSVSVTNKEITVKNIENVAIFY